MIDILRRVSFSSAILILLSVGYSAFAGQTLFLGIGGEFANRTGGTFEVELCSVELADCETVSLEAGQAVGAEKLRRVLQSRPAMSQGHQVHLRWRLKRPETNQDLVTGVSLLTSEIQSGSIWSIYFADGTYISQAPCIKPGGVSLDARGLLYFGDASSVFIDTKKTELGRTYGSITLTCS